MIVSAEICQLKTPSELVGKTCRVVSVDRQSAALFRAVECERSNNDVTARFDGLIHARDVSGAVRCINQKMKGGPVMPNVEGLRRRPFGHVRHDPFDLACPRAESCLGGFERGFRNIQNRHMIEPAGDKAINKT